MILWLGSVLVFSTASFAPATEQDGLSQSSAPAALPGTAGRNAPSKDSTGGGGNAGARVAANFIVLMSREGREIGRFTGAIAFQTMLWGLGAWLVGSLAGYAIFWILRKRSLLDARFCWYRFVRWIWPVLFVVFIGTGLGYAGFWLGGGRAFHKQIHEQRVLDKLVAHLLCAIALDHAQYTATGAETIEAYTRVLGDSDTISDVVEKDFDQEMKALQSKLSGRFAQPWWLALFSNLGLGELLGKLRGMNSRLLFVTLMEHPNLDEYVSKHPEASPSVVALSLHLKLIRDNACLWVDGMVYSHAAIGVATGFGPPLLAFIFFRLTIWLCSICRRVAVLPPSRRTGSTTEKISPDIRA